LELDIDSISVPTLWKIYDLVTEHSPDTEIRIRKQISEKESPRNHMAKPASKKKNKPMSKHEQERKIEQLKNSMQQFERQGSGSQEPVLPSKL
jgi:bromodomain-containing factor 1